MEETPQRYRIGRQTRLRRIVATKEMQTIASANPLDDTTDADPCAVLSDRDDPVCGAGRLVDALPPPPIGYQHSICEYQQQRKTGRWTQPPRPTRECSRLDAMALSNRQRVTSQSGVREPRVLFSGHSSTARKCRQAMHRYRCSHRSLASSLRGTPGNEVATPETHEHSGRPGTHRISLRPIPCPACHNLPDLERKHQRDTRTWSPHQLCFHDLRLRGSAIEATFEVGGWERGGGETWVRSLASLRPPPASLQCCRRVFLHAIRSAPAPTHLAQLPCVGIQLGDAKRFAQDRKQNRPQRE